MKIKNDKGYTLKWNHESDTATLIFRTYAYNEISLNETARRINVIGGKPRIVEEWTASAIKDILRNPAYIGKVKWNARKTVIEYKNGRVIKTRPRNDDYILCDGLHEPLIDMQTWNIVQEKLSRHEAAVPHNNTVQNPLLGIVHCAKCGKRMQRRPYKLKGVPDTLLCPNKKCDNISSKLCIVEEKIIQSLKDWLKDYNIDVNHYMKEIESKKKNNYQESVKNLEKELELQNKKLSNVYDYFEEGSYSREMFAERCQIITNEINSIKCSIDEFNKLIEQENKKEEDKIKIIPKLENVIDLYFKLDTPEEKNLLLKTVVKRVEYLKVEKAIKKDSDPTDFELDIYPNIG